MKVLVACESSGTVREAFRKKGHNAWSCDLLPADDGSKFHIQGDALEAIKQKWDLIIAHSPCTFLCGSGIHNVTRTKKEYSNRTAKRKGTD
jgi:hypothetical protein